MNAAEISDVEGTQDTTLFRGISQMLFIIAPVQANFHCRDNINSAFAQGFDQSLV